MSFRSGDDVSRLARLVASQSFVELFRLCWHSLVHILKYVSKPKAHFVKMVHIFRNFNGMCDFTFAMHFYHHGDNFQP